MFRATGSNSHTHVELMSDPEHVYLNPTNNTSYGDVVKVNDVGYIKTEYHTGTRTNFLSSFKTYPVCDDGRCCIEDVEELQQHVTTDFKSAVKVHPVLDDWEWSYDLQQWNRFPGLHDIGRTMRWNVRTNGGSPGYGADWRTKDYFACDFIYTTPTVATGIRTGDYWRTSNSGATSSSPPTHGLLPDSMPGARMSRYARSGNAYGNHITVTNPSVYIRNKVTQSIFPYLKHSTTGGMNIISKTAITESQCVSRVGSQWLTVYTSNSSGWYVWLTSWFAASAGNSLVLPQPKAPVADHVDAADKVYLNPNNNVIAGTPIMFQGRCYTKTGQTGTMTHLLTAVDTSDLVISEDSIVSPTSGA